MSVEMPLSPVCKYAITESGKYGPLKKKDLIILLGQKFDRRRKETVEVIHTFSEDVEGVKKQLEKLRNRIEEIEAAERHRSNFLRKMIRRVLAGKYAQGVFQILSFLSNFYLFIYCCFCFICSLLKKKKMKVSQFELILTHFL